MRKINKINHNDFKYSLLAFINTNKQRVMNHNTKRNKSLKIFIVINHKLYVVHSFYF